MKKFLLILVSLFIMGTPSVMAQASKVAGKVTDASGTPLFIGTHSIISILGLFSTLLPRFYCGKICFVKLFYANLHLKTT